MVFPWNNKEAAANSDELLDYNDYPKVRQNFQDRMKAAVETAFPIGNDRYTLTVSDLNYRGQDTYSLKEQKKAILEGRSLDRKLVGKWQVVDNETGQTVSKSNYRTLLNVPYLTDRGTYIRNGTEYTVSKQFRLTPGVYSRVTDDGLVESQFNVKPRTGRGFRVFMEPSTSVFYMRYAGRKVPLYPIMRAMGYNEKELDRTWGKEITAKNKEFERSPYAVNFLKQFQEDEEDLQKSAADDEYSIYRRKLMENFTGMELDPESTESTLGAAFSNVTPEAIMLATNKILKISRQQAEGDDRDSLEFQTIHDFSDFMSEKIQHDQNQVMRSLLWKLTNKNGAQDVIPSSPLDKHLSNFFNHARLSQAVEEINPLDMYDQNQRVVRLGEGGISSVEAVPKESRNVQPSYLNFIDAVRAPESLKIGVDMKMATNVRKGKDGLLYTQFVEPRTGKKRWVSMRQASKSTVAFPEAMASSSKFVPAITKGKTLQYVNRNDVDFIVPSGDDMFSDGANTVPLKSGVKAMRLLMGSKFGPQALPLVQREAPFVRTADDKGGSTEASLGKYMGAVKSPKPGVVKAVRKDRIEIEHADGTSSSIDIYDNFPFSRKTFIRNTPVVKAGDRVTSGQLLATSNFTDDKGVSALGKNLRVAYMNYDGKVFEDAIVISESAAKALTSEHMYHDDIEKDKNMDISKKKYAGIYPAKFTRDQLDKVDDDGVVKVGSVLQYGDPMFLAVSQTDPSPATMGRRLRRDESRTWEHHFPGVVTDAVKTKKGYRVNVRANVPMGVGDKLSNRFGGKGVVSEVVKDEDMPKDAKGNPYQVILSPLGVISRTNSSQLVEAALGKVSAKTGKIYNLPGFMEEDMVDLAMEELKKANLSDTEDVYEPRSNKTVKDIFTGNSYFYKMQHTAEGKGKSRATAGYTQEEQPSRGGKRGAKHLGDMEIQAILSHGTPAVLKDLKIIKGQKNDDFWRQLKLGHTPTTPGTPMVYNKFKSLIKAAGVNLVEDKDADNIFAMTNAQARDLTGNRQIVSSETFGANSMRPIVGGLFDPDATGSEADGDRWGYIELPQPLPNPIMEDPLRSILGMTQKEFKAAVANPNNAESIYGLLDSLDIKAEKRRAMDEIKRGARSKRDAAMKRFSYLDAMEKQGVKPTDFMMTRVPVLPPKYRPITKMNEMTMVADANYMYKALIDSVQDYKDTSEMPDPVRTEAKSNIYDSYKALVGLTDPVQQKLEQKNVGGILKQIFGKGSPKTGFVQRRVIGTNLDVTGLSVVTPNPSLKLDEVGLPEELAWDLYEPFIVRHLVQQGIPATQASKSVASKTKQAYTAMQKVIKDRPVLVNRAPSLHKYNILAFNPVLTKGHTLQVPPSIVKGFAMDFDGDTASYSVPVSADAVKEAYEKMMPSKNLIGARSDKPMFTPSNEYLQGLYYASKAPKNKAVRKFATKKDAQRAFKRGEIDIDDPIEILHE